MCDENSTEKWCHYHKPKSDRVTDALRIPSCDKDSRVAAGSASNMPICLKEWKPNPTSYIRHAAPSLFVQAILSFLWPDPSCQNCNRHLQASSRHTSTPEAASCWLIVTTMSACLLRVMFQSRHDRSSATRFNPGGSNSRGTKQPPTHITILMTTSCHDQRHKDLITNMELLGTHISLSCCLCTTGHNMGQQTTIVYVMVATGLLALVSCSPETGPLSVWMFVKTAHVLSVSRPRA